MTLENDKCVFNICLHTVLYNNRYCTKFKRFRLHDIMLIIPNETCRTNRTAKLK